MIAQTGPPAGWLPPVSLLCTWRRPTARPQTHSSPWLRGASQKRIFDTDPSDQHAQLGVDLRSAFGGARLPSPVAAKSGPVPAHDRAVQNVKQAYTKFLLASRLIQISARCIRTGAIKCFARTDARFLVLAETRVPGEDWRLKKTGGQTCKARFRSTRRWRSPGGVARAGPPAIN
jgi:hypothetical protein